MPFTWWLRKKLFDHEPVVEIVHTEPLYKYEIEHLNGEISESIGNASRRDEGFITIMEKDEVTWAIATFKMNDNYTGPPAFSYWDGYNDIDEFGSVKEVSKGQVGEDIITIGYDREEDTWWIEDRVKDFK